MSVPITDWVLGPLAPTAGGAARARRRCARRGLFRDEYVGRLRQGQNEPNETRRRRIGERLWALAMLEAWLRVFVDGRGRRPGGDGMKCIRCGHDSKYKERTDRHVPEVRRHVRLRAAGRRPADRHGVPEGHRRGLGRGQRALGRRAPLLRGLPPQRSRRRRSPAAASSPPAVASVPGGGLRHPGLSCRASAAGGACWRCRALVADRSRRAHDRARASEFEPAVRALGARSTASRRA